MNLKLANKMAGISRRAASLIPGSAIVKAAKSRLFAGDPVEIPSDIAGDALVGETNPEDVPAQAIAASGASEDSAAAKLAAFEDMSMADRASVVRLSPLSVWNATLIQEPVMSKILADNLNYFVQKLMVEHPITGGIAPFTDTTHAEDLGLAINPMSIEETDPGKIVVVPFFRFNISASQLQARPGGNYSMWIEGYDQDGLPFSTPNYSFQRKDITKPITGVYIPFTTISTRTLPKMAMMRNANAEAGVTELALTVHIKGLDPTEVVTVSILGYSMSELRDICKMYNLPAGLAQ